MEHRIWLVGINHQSAPGEVREAVALSPPEVDSLLKAGCENHSLAELFILSTCNRTEMCAVGTAPGGIPARLLGLLETIRPLPPDRHFYTYGAANAARHLMAVSTGIDSMILGEVQIQGQVKEAHRQGSSAGTLGQILNRLLMTAMHVGKRSRTETEIGRGAVSVASAAITLPLRIISDLSDKTVLIVGTGETGTLVARHFHARSPRRILLSNRTPEKARLLAAELDASTVPVEDLGSVLPEADVIVCAVRSRSIILTEERLREAMSRRRHRLMVVVDISVPRCVEPTVAKIDNIFSYSIDALQKLVDKNLARRRQETPKIEAMIDIAVDGFLKWLRALAVAPVTTELRSHLEQLEQEELARRINKFSPEDRPKAKALARAIVAKILHQPTVAIKDLRPDHPETLRRLDTIRKLFGLEGDSKP